MDAPPPTRSFDLVKYRIIRLGEKSQSRKLKDCLNRTTLPY